VRYQDRTDAGRLLAAELVRLGLPHPRVVLALPRGGVPVAVEIAAALAAPLGIVVVRKIPAPGHSELAMGALAIIGTEVAVFCHEDVVRRLQIDQSTFASARELGEVAIRRRAAELNPSAIELAGAQVVVVDDGLATGSTMLAAVAAVRRAAPAAIIVATPVGAASAVSTLSVAADRVVCPLVPRGFVAVGLSYRNFDQLDDGEVKRLLGAGPGSS
jgi:putative phosphoribosyl transferase